jgi:hypothetical protein
VTASNVKVELRAEEEESDDESTTGPTEQQVTVSAPKAVDMTKDRVDRAIVDNWNEEALKSLAQGSSTAFYEIDDLVIIDAKKAPGAQPYLTWARQQNEVDPNATITMTKKGGAFAPGKIIASGVQDTATFEAAIKRISKKKVEYH